MLKTKTSNVAPPIVRKPTVRGQHEEIVAILDNAKEKLDRSSYLELLVRVADTTNDRSDQIHEQIAKEHHEDRDRD